MEEKETVREPYRMVLEGGQAELVEKKSRFIANVRPVESEAEAVAFIDEMKKKLEGIDFDVIAGAESRGFIFGMPIAYNLQKASVTVCTT